MYTIETRTITRTQADLNPEDIITVAQAIKLLKLSRESSIGSMIERGKLTRVIDNAEPNTQHATRLLKAEVMSLRAKRKAPRSKQSGICKTSYRYY